MSAACAAVVSITTWHAVGLGPLAQEVEHLEPVELRHRDVEEDEVGLLGDGRLESGLAVLGLDDLVAAAAERDVHEQPYLPVVVGDEDLLHT